MMTKSIWFSLLILLVAFLVFEFTALDILIQNYFYNFDTGQWLVSKDASIPKLIFYDGIKKAYILLVLSVLIGLVFFRQHRIIVQYKKGLLIVLLSCLAVPLFVASLKAITNVPCPKDLQQYGGRYPYVTVLSTYPDTFEQTGKIRCYPAGHASGGFALMALLFLFTSKRKKRFALASAIVIGWTIGSYKMLIGDHFFSHTLITMMLSWLIINFIAHLVGKYYFQEHIEKA